MNKKIKEGFIEKTHKSPLSGQKAEIIEDFKFKTDKKNQLLAFFKPEVFLDKPVEKTEKIIDLSFKKLEENEVSIDGAAVFTGGIIGKYSIMDRHYGVINTLSKNASKILTKEEREIIFKALNIKNKNTRIMGGHEAFEIAGIGKTVEFDNYWLSTPATKIKSGFYVRTMKVAGEEMVVVNGFHPHQLAHYTDNGRYLGVMLVSSNTPWNKLRTEMLGETFPDKALSTSIRGTVYEHPSEYGFKKVGIDNNIMHLSAGPSEALFEIDNFMRDSFGVDFIKKEAKLAYELLDKGLSPEKIKKLILDKELHGQLEHKETDESVQIITSKYK